MNTSKSFLSANASATLHLIYKILIDNRGSMPWAVVQRDFWNSIQQFIDNTSPVGNQTDLFHYKHTIDDLFEALEFFIENRYWFSDIKGFVFSKHITTRILNKIKFVQDFEYEDEGDGFLYNDHSLYLQFVNAGAPEEHLAQFPFHNSS